MGFTHYHIIRHHIKHYYLKRKFFTTNESRFYNILHETLKKEYGLRYKIFSKVRLWDIIDIREDVSEKYTYQNKIARKHIDFLILDKYDNYKPVLAIELNGTSHNTIEAKENDKFKFDVLEEAGIPLLFFRNGERVCTDKLFNMLC